MMSVMRLIADPNVMYTGEIIYKGRNLMGLSRDAMREVRGEEISMIFQDPMTSLNPVYNIGWQIEEQLNEHYTLRKGQARQRAVELLRQVGIPNAEQRVDNYPHEFSGGMRQRVMIALALSCNPDLLIADEPTTALDVTIQAQILDLLRALVAEENAALILITHDLGVVAGMCERVNVMYAGMFMETGSADQLFGAPRHPYTLGLLQSVPRLDAARRARLHPIEGAPPNMLRAPEACPFQPRCRFEVDLSRQQVPPLVEIEPGHQVACFNPVPLDEWDRTRVAATA
jgi:oligopeptide transport system ATP-binding protein